METKKCSTCKEKKPIAEFCNDKSQKDGFSIRCRTCMKIYKAKYYKKNAANIYKKTQKWVRENPEKVKEIKAKWARNNPEKVKGIGIKWTNENAEKLKNKRVKRYNENAERIKDENKKRYLKNPEKVKEINAKWKNTNPEKVKEGNRKAEKTHRENLTDRYLIQNIKRTIKIPPEIIKEHPELIDNYRMQIKVKRLLKNKKDENSKTS